MNFYTVLKSFNSVVLPGGYAFLDSSPPRLPGDKAVLVSKTGVEFEGGQNGTAKCLQFWVSTFGSRMGNLRCNCFNSI